MLLIILLFTGLLGYASFVILRSRRFRQVPIPSILIFYMFLCSAAILIAYFTASMLVCMRLFLWMMGGMLILLGVNSLHSFSRCTCKVDGIYRGYRSYYGSNGVSSQSPVFEYSYGGKAYHEQTTQTVSFRTLTKKMSEGSVYPIFIDPKHPNVFLLRRRFPFVDLFLGILGIAVIAAAHIAL